MKVNSHYESPKLPFKDKTCRKPILEQSQEKKEKNE